MKEETGRRENVGAAIHFLSDSTLVRCFTSWLRLFVSSIFFYFITSSMFCSFSFKFLVFLNSEIYFILLSRMKGKV